MDGVLKKGAEARKYGISLQSVEYSGDLSQDMLKFSSKMENLFLALQDLYNRKVEDPAAYQKFFKIIDDRLQWFEKAEVGRLWMVFFFH